VEAKRQAECDLYAGKVEEIRREMEEAEERQR